MPDSELVRKRMPSLDGTSFRFECKDHTLFVNERQLGVKQQQRKRW